MELEKGLSGLQLASTIPLYPIGVTIAISKPIMIQRGQWCLVNRSDRLLSSLYNGNSLKVQENGSFLATEDRIRVIKVS